jgi:dCTP deaminase
MCLLADSDIQAAIEKGELTIEPFSPEDLTPNGLDLRIGEIYLEATQETIKQGTAVIPPGAWFAVSTNEVLTLGPRLAGQLWIRSTWARKGAVAGFGKVEAGFSGTLTIGAANLKSTPLEIPIGDRFCQIVFETLHSTPQSLYAERSGNYQNQRGVTLAPNDQ